MSCCPRAATLGAELRADGARERPPLLWHAEVCRVARPEGLEPPACWFEANRSIRLSYGRVLSL